MVIVKFILVLINFEGEILMDINLKHRKIKEIVEKELACSAHKLDHVLRVYNLCMLLSKYEKN